MGHGAWYGQAGKDFERQRWSLKTSVGSSSFCLKITNWKNSKNVIMSIGLCAIKGWQCLFLFSKYLNSLGIKVLEF